MMHTIWNYTTVFLQMVVVSCITEPVNWKYCLKIDQWLIPDVQRGVEVYFNPSSIYAEERKYLENINKERK